MEFSVATLLCGFEVGEIMSGFIDFGYLGVVVFVFTQFAVQNGNAQCELRLDAQPEWLPLIWNSSGQVVYPIQNTNGIWVIPMAKGQTVNVGCAPEINLLENFNLSVIKVFCSKTSLMGPLGAITSFSTLGCSRMIKEEVLDTLIPLSTHCSPGLESVVIEHKVLNTRLPLINLCYDPSLDATVMSSHRIQGRSLNPYEVSNDRPGFKSAQFYSQFSVATAYTQAEQLKTVTALVGSSSLGAKYIDVSKSFYFARGHLAPDGDFVHVYEQNATYYYVNVIPQWQSINNGNWKALEVAIRKYAVQNEIDLQVWTGSYGILELDDVNGNPVQINLGKGKYLPVPKISIKIILDKERNASVAVLMLNNPHIDSIQANDIICPDICDQITWITWTNSDLHKGYTYCCDVNELRKVYPQFPAFGNVSILT